MSLLPLSLCGRPSGNYSLPLPLTVLTPLPASINTSIVDEEKQTYYWYVALLYGLWY
jgi:hypothetical protein